MAKTAIVLSGPGNSGKTHIIVQAAVLFRDESGITPEPPINVTDGSEDVCCVFTVTPKLKVGFVSWGDIPGQVDDYLNELHDCEIIVCAVRSRGETTKKLIKRWEDEGGQFVWIKHAKMYFYKEDDFFCDALCKRNKAMAEFINWCVNTEIDKRNA